jgi:hypothetical protein
MPTVFVQDGFRFYFYSNERNEPAHIHVTGRGGEMKLWLPSLRIEYSFGLSPASQGAAYEITKKYANLFMGKWNEYSSKKD